MRLRNIPGADEVVANSSFCIQNPNEHKGHWSSVFENDNPIHIEIGMGKGRFLMDLAALNPDINYIGIERYTSVLLRAIQKMEEEELPNLKFIRMDAEDITKVFGKGEVDKIYLNFSDPWKKSKQAKRRLTHKNFLDRYKKVLNSGDYIWFKTDNLKLFEFSLNSFCDEGFKLRNITLDLHNSGFEGNVVTEYEQRFMDLGQPIYRLEATF